MQTFFYTKTLVDLMSASANDRGDLFFWDRRTYPIVAGFFLSLFFLIYWLHIAITDFSQEIALAHFHSVWTFSSIFIGGVVLSEFEYISAVKVSFPNMFPLIIFNVQVAIYGQLPDHPSHESLFNHFHSITVRLFSNRNPHLYYRNLLLLWHLTTCGIRYGEN